jgi:hypothetical protein
MTKLSVFIGTASGNVDVGIYSSDGTTLTRLVSSGSTAAAGASAVQTITVASAALVPSFSYYLAVAPDNATVTIGRVAITSAICRARQARAGVYVRLPTAVNAHAVVWRQYEQLPVHLWRTVMAVFEWTIPANLAPKVTDDTPDAVKRIPDGGQGMLRATRIDIAKAIRSAS